MSIVQATKTYGPLPDQVGDLLVPDGHGPHPVVVLIHGGAWRESAKRANMAQRAQDLTGRGWATWNIEYRRVGESGGGFPETFQDVANAVDYLINLSGEYDLDLNRIVFFGHSSGGHLAAWAGSRHMLPQGAPGAEPSFEPMAVVSSAGILDLEEAHRLVLSNNATEDFIHETVPSRYKLTSPITMLPAHRPTILVHGDSDTHVPLDQSLRYFDKARVTEDLTPLLTVVPGADHFAVSDTTGEGWKRGIAALDWVLSVSHGSSPPLPNDFVGPESKDVDLLMCRIRRTSNNR